MLCYFEYVTFYTPASCDMELHRQGDHLNELTNMHNNMIPNFLQWLVTNCSFVS